MGRETLSGEGKKRKNTCRGAGGREGKGERDCCLDYIREKALGCESSGSVVEDSK